MKSPALNLFILLDYTKNVGNIDYETVLSYQIGRLKKYFKQIFVLIDGSNKYKFLGVPIFWNKYKKYKSLGKIFIGLSKTKYAHNIFMRHDMLSLDIDKILKMVEQAKDFDAVINTKNGLINYEYGLFKKEVFGKIKQLFDDAKLSEQDILKQIKVNYIEAK
jgi:molybdopterin-guanine dinucleotide biosynthesis protein A